MPYKPCHLIWLWLNFIFCFVFCCWYICLIYVKVGVGRYLFTDGEKWPNLRVRHYWLYHFGMCIRDCWCAILVPQLLCNFLRYASIINLNNFVHKNQVLNFARQSEQSELTAGGLASSRRRRRIASQVLFFRFIYYLIITPPKNLWNSYSRTFGPRSFRFR